MKIRSIESSPPDRLDVEISDATGRRMFFQSEKMKGNYEIQISLSLFPSGMYTLKLSAAGESPVLRKLIKY